MQTSMVGRTASVDMYRKSVAARQHVAAPAVASRLAVKSAQNKLIKHLLSSARSSQSNIARRATAEATTELTTNPLSIVFVAAEVSPWSKTGGLGDVVGGLPIELAKRGHRVISIAPRYDQYYDGWDTSVVVNVDGEQVRFFHAVKKGVHRVFVDHPWFLAKVWGKTGSKLYGPKSGADFVDNHKRFSLFCKAAIEAVKALPFGDPENTVFVANDWHSALVPVLIKDVYQPRGEFTKSKVAYCIHNIAFQGRMWESTFKEMGLPQKSFEKFSFEDGYPKVYTEADPMEEDEVALASGKRFKKLNWMKAGILSADKLLTVSPNYASEISADDEKGVELDKYIKAAGGVEGIVNGMDIEEWDPLTDKFLDVNYNKSTVYPGKAAAKEALQAELGLPVDPSVPLFAFIGRLEEQKGVDILLKALQLVKGENIQVAILGTGKAKLEAELKNLSKLSPKFKGVVKFSAPLAHMLTAGADYMLVPSRFEPCGLIQLHAMQYGTPCLVSSTGGLVDTVKEGITGFHFGAMDPAELLDADAQAIASTMKRAAQAFSTPLWKDMVANAISQDLSWSKPAKKWEGILEGLVSGKTAAKSSEKAESVKTPVQEPLSAAKVGEIKANADTPMSFPKPAPKPAGSIVGAGAAPAGAKPAAPGAPKPSPGVAAATSNGAAKAPKVTLVSPTTVTTGPVKAAAAKADPSSIPQPTPPKAANGAAPAAAPAAETSSAPKNPSQLVGSSAGKKA